MGGSREIVEKIETGNLVACIDAALTFVAALLPVFAFAAAFDTALDTARATVSVAAAVVLPDLKLAAFAFFLAAFASATLAAFAIAVLTTADTAFTTSTFRVSLVFRFTSTTPSTTAALLSLLAAVIQFSSLVVVTPCRSRFIRRLDRVTSLQID